MRIVECKRRTMVSRIFSGKVRILIQGLATDGHSMTSVDGMPSRSITVDMTTPEDVYELIRSIVKECEEAQNVDNKTKPWARTKEGL